MLDPRVYRDLIIRVVLVGAMSTGKSTLAENLAKEFKTSYMPEYGREYWEKRQVKRRLTLEDLENIVRIHQKREDEACLSADRFLFVDTCALSTFLFSHDYHGKATDYVTQKANEDYKRYDLFFLCGTDIPYEDTWDRSGPQKREDFQKLYQASLLERKIPFIPLFGSLEMRTKKVQSILEKFKKFGNFYGEKLESQ
jgi:NadR type nicotinamide-nucleotide adenylyltransferase